MNALLSKDIPLANTVLDTSFDFTNLWNLCLQANTDAELTSLALTSIRRVIDSLEQIQQHTHEIANISIDRAEAADARSSTTTTSKINHSLFGKNSKPFRP